MDRAKGRLSIRRKASVILEVYATLLAVAWAVRTRPLPDVVQKLSRQSGGSSDITDARRLGRIVGRLLKVGPWQPRCLYRALTLYRMVRRRGEAAELVIGLPDRPLDKDAHAWVEIDGRDVGPPPGRTHHEAIVRYGSNGAVSGGTLQSS